MLARIEHVGIHTPSGLVYVEAAYWPGFAADGEPTLRNDFLIQVHTSAEQLVTDSAGRIRTASSRWLLPHVEVDGDWQPRREDPADPWIRETVKLDQRAQAVDVVTAYGRRAAAASGDHRGVDRDAVTPVVDTELTALAGEYLAF